MRINKHNTQEKEFTSLTDPIKLTADQLNNIRQPIPPKNIDDYTNFYAIARINGVLSVGKGQNNMSDGASVLYMSSNYNAFERLFKEVEGCWKNIPRVTYRESPDAKDGKDWMKKQYDKLIDEHRRLDEENPNSNNDQHNC